MNKYSSKAIKTAATVGMSLAMVLSAAAPVMAATAPAVPSLKCDGSDTVANNDGCKDVFYDLSKAIEKIGLDELTLDSEGTINGADKQNIAATILSYKAGLVKFAEGSDYSTLRKWTDVIDKLIDANGKDDDTATGMFDKAKFLAGNPQTNDDSGLVNYYSKMLADTGATGWKDLTSGDAATKQKAAVKAFEKMEKWVEEGYADRLNDDLADRFDEVYNDLEEVTSEYRSSDEDVTNLFVAAWSTVLEQDLNGNKTLDFGKNKTKFEAETKLSEGEKTIDLSNKTEIKGRIDAIKDAPNYYRVKKESAVEDIIAQYNDLLGTITDLKNLLKDDSYKAFLTTKTDDADATVKSVISGFKYTEKTDEKKMAKELAKTLDVEQYEILKAMVEDVLNNAYNFETKKVGNYYVDKSGWVDGFTGSSTINRDLGNSKYLLNLVDTKEGKFGLDIVMTHLADFVEAWDAVTTDIERLTPANIKAKDKATLEAAEDAYYEMTSEKGVYVNNLTKDQEKQLRKIRTKIENLREAFDNLGVTNVAGWYDMGNGNWGYNNEDGTPAAYKWVASGANWYMIKDGKMLRNTWIATDGGRWYYVDNAGKMVTNQSVDGCWINSYGVYMSPSYNG